MSGGRRSNGAEAGDSISSFYRVTVEFVATGGLDD